MKTIVPVASGKGGVGKTVITANLAVRLAQRGKTVVVVDLDLGGSNLHTCLGVRNDRAGIGQLIHRKGERLESLLVETSQRRLFFIPGDSLLPGTANLPYFRKTSILKDLDRLVADYVLLDLGAGSSYNTIDFFLSSSSGLVVISPETTSVLNAYSLLKGAVFRMLHRSFPPKSRERRAVSSFSTERLEGSESSVADLIGRIRGISEQSANVASERLKHFLPRVVLNMARSRQDLSVAARLRTVSRRNLRVEVQYVGVLHSDPEVSASILRRTPDVLLRPESKFARGMGDIADRLIQAPSPRIPKLYEADEDLVELSEATDLP